ncbi:hypothetical protein E4K65_01765 [Bradyrhizobium niftali]|uniref:Uncharacterized protein n=1 Tax=Bradyrhizobium niftali TaxID=2560055 RepID=A0A4Y9M6M2_9BRAD|nr:hypothetical protein E4K65_01765 [Bradyrhizobium niftali]
MRGSLREDGDKWTRNLSSSSLRAQRSNPESLRGPILDCFAALAMTMWIELCVYHPNRRVESPPHPESALRANSGLSPQAGRGEEQRARSASAARGSSSAHRCRTSRARTRRWCACD